MAMKYVKWVPPDAPKEENNDADDIDLDSSDAQFKLAAMVIDDFLNDKEKYKFKSLDNFVSETPLKDFIKQRRAKLESADDTWTEIDESLPDANK